MPSWASSHTSQSWRFTISKISTASTGSKSGRVITSGSKSQSQVTQVRWRRDQGHFKNDEGNLDLFLLLNPSLSTVGLHMSIHFILYQNTVSITTKIELNIFY